LPEPTVLETAHRAAADAGQLRELTSPERLQVAPVARAGPCDSMIRTASPMAVSPVSDMQGSSLLERRHRLLSVLVRFWRKEDHGPRVWI
jgi:hypothetical protein